MKNTLTIILATIFLLCVWGSILALEHFFNSQVEMSPAQLIKQCELPAELEPHILLAIHDTDLGTVNVELNCKPSAIPIHPLLTEEGWRYRQQHNSYKKGKIKIYVDEDTYSLFIK